MEVICTFCVFGVWLGGFCYAVPLREGFFAGMMRTTIFEVPARTARRLSAESWDGRTRGRGGSRSCFCACGQSESRRER